MTRYGWVDAESLAEREDWASALDPDTLALCLEAAHEACVAYLNGRDPAPGAEDTPPARLQLAQTMHARDLSRMAYTDPNGSYGPEGMGVSVFPMDWRVKGLLRPRRGRRGPR